MTQFPLGEKMAINLEQIKQSISKGESDALEFKKSTATLKGAAETLCAFLNGQGGNVIIGVTNNKQVVGQHVNDQTQQEIANTLRKFEPTVNIEIQYLNIQDDKSLIILTAHPDNRSRPYTFDGRAYERNGTTTSLMTQNQYQQLLLARSLKPMSWESQPAIGYTISDLDQNEIMNTISDITRKRRLESGLSGENVTDILTRLKLIENGHITNAAVVLFSKEISGNYLQCVIRMARFRGLEKGPSIDSNHVHGNAFQLLKEAEIFINRNTAIASYMKNNDMARVDEPEYPVEAIREALINAICHRDYASLGGSITLTIFDDRLEIANNGLLLSDITIADLSKPHTSHPRNPRITNVFFRRGLIESMGIGTQEIIKACKTANMKTPDFYEQAGAFVVRLWSRHYQEKSETQILSERQLLVLKTLTDQPLSTQEIFIITERAISVRTLRRELQFLNKNGYISHVGQASTSKWFLKQSAQTGPNQARLGQTGPNRAKPGQDPDI